MKKNILSNVYSIIKNVRLFYVISCTVVLSSSCNSSNRHENDNINDEYVNRIDENNEDVSVSDSHINSEWIEIGELTALQWVVASYDNNIMSIETVDAPVWYKLIDGEKVYSIYRRGRILTKNTYKTIKVYNGSQDDYEIIDVSGYNYMHENISNGGGKLVEFISLP